MCLIRSHGIHGVKRIRQDDCKYVHDEVFNKFSICTAKKAQC